MITILSTRDLLILKKNCKIMQTASFTGFVKTILYIMAFYYIFRFVAKLLLPHIVKKVVQKAGENLNKQYQNPQNTSWQKTKSASEVLYNTPKTQNPRETNKVGDYVDFEEL
jgi:hypothetical protein